MPGHGQPHFSLRANFQLAPEIDDRLIAQVMGQFGTVRQQVRERYPAEYNLSVFSGVRGVHMEIAKEIPANIFIGHFRARIYYDGLKNRCFYCKEEGHQKANCPKLAAASASNGGGARSYSTVAAHGRPVIVPSLTVPVMAPNMQILSRKKDENSNQAEPSEQATRVTKESSKPEHSRQETSIDSGSESLDSTNLERAKTEEKMQPMDADSKQGQKRVATSTPSSQLVDSSPSEEGGVTDA